MYNSSLRRQLPNQRISFHQTFFEELLKEQTIVIPGIFFDINPSHRRNLFNSPCHHFVRLSFGPPLEDLNKGMSIEVVEHLCYLINHLGLDAIDRVLKRAKKAGMKDFGQGQVLKLVFLGFSWHCDLRYKTTEGDSKAWLVPWLFTTRQQAGI